MSAATPKPGTTASLVLFSLVPEPSSVTKTSRDEHIAHVSREMQMTGVHTPLAAVSTMWNGASWATDRLTEIMGRVASSGEQIGLALAASRDARRWLNDDAAATSESEVVAVRAHAEMLTYWALGAAHGLGNVLLRMLWLDTNARPLLEAAYPKAESFEPFSNSRDAWEQFGPKVIKIARKASGAAASSTGTTIVDALDSLTADPRWDRLMVLRGVNFHQWRPQSLRGGTPKHSMVKENPDGQQMITVESA